VTQPDTEPRPDWEKQEIDAHWLASKYSMLIGHNVLEFILAASGPFCGLQDNAPPVFIGRNISRFHLVFQSGCCHLSDGFCPAHFYWVHYFPFPLNFSKPLLLNRPWLIKARPRPILRTEIPKFSRTPYKALANGSHIMASNSHQYTNCKFFNMRTLYT
jgi:hypothetical protein